MTDRQKLDFALCANGNLTRDEVEQKMNTGFYAMDVKLDGIRASIYSCGGTVRILTRGGRNIADQFPHITNHFRSIEPNWAIHLDGELVSKDFKFRTVQAAIQSTNPADFSKTPYVDFYAFDMLKGAYNPDMQNMNWSLRRSLLNDLSSYHGVTQVVSERDPVVAMDLYDHLLDVGGEGVVLKHVNKPYIPGRSDAWMRSKYKNTINLLPLDVHDNLTVDVMVYNFDEKAGVLVGSVQMPEEDLFFLLQKDLNVIIEAEAYGVDSKTGKLRHLTYKGMRFDSDKSSCNIEQLDHFRNYS